MTLMKVDLRGLAVGDDLLGQQAKLLAEIIHGRQRLFCFLSDLPVLVKDAARPSWARPTLATYFFFVLFEFHCVFFS